MCVCALHSCVTDGGILRKSIRSLKKERKKGEQTHNGTDGRKTERRLGELVRAARNCCSDPAPLMHPAHLPPSSPSLSLKRNVASNREPSLLPPLEFPWQQHHSDAISVTGAQLFQTRRNHGGRRWRTPWWQQRWCPLVTSRSQGGEVGVAGRGRGRYINVWQQFIRLDSSQTS